jgi:hypothetical protein
MHRWQQCEATQRLLEVGRDGSRHHAHMQVALWHGGEVTSRPERRESRCRRQRAHSRGRDLGKEAFRQVGSDRQRLESGNGHGPVLRYGLGWRGETWPARKEKHFSFFNEFSK